MHTSVDCMPCFVRQALNAARMVSTNLGLQERVIKEVFLLLKAKFSVIADHAGVPTSTQVLMRSGERLAIPGEQS